MLKNVVSESEERSSPEMITNDKTLQISYSEKIQGRYYKKVFVEKQFKDEIRNAPSRV
jgi:hypothetical protein